MTVTAIVGANWGDEGKGKMTDLLGEDADFVVRYQGGGNAGHTIINEYGKFALHLLPSGVFRQRTVNVIGPGVALDIRQLLTERERLLARGVPEPQLRVSDRAQIVLPYHKRFDELEEARLGDRAFGSTKSGIAPFYADKYMKIGVQVADLYDESRLRARLNASLAAKNVLLRELYGEPPIDAEALLPQLLDDAAQLAPFVCDTTALLREAAGNGANILLEGQLGALRDPDHGIYPFTTSSSTLAGYAAVGAGVTSASIGRVVAVTKAYSSCVGAGPFVTELFEAEAEELRKRGGDAGEYGVKTGRPRRVGWFDAVATRYGCLVQGATEIALTNLDVLGYLADIPVCSYYEIDGQRTELFPASVGLDRAKPVFETMPGWQTDISHIRTFGELPEKAQAYVRYVERQCGVPVSCVSVGPRREQVIRLGC
ncbi:adenylosuccinate synthase [Paenibacillus sp. MBLB4367]|uniref:adenylosuccinate synthase n=1 Tax=Paenibacillus sp. MBLB4367 TaxID=3384767 RepID=UPI0039080CC0